MSEKCPVCEHPVGVGVTKCETCGFEDERGVNREWFNVEDANRWTETVVKPCRAIWEAARSRKARLLAELEEAEKQRVEPAVPEMSFTDPRDGQVYRMVKIGGLVWMAENLNYKIANSWCYGNDEYDGKKYGRLYTWEAAKAACPKGWGLPSRAEWDDLVCASGGKAVAGEKLKSKTGWVNRKDGTSGNGTDDYGFSALPGGSRNFYVGTFNNVGSSGRFWSADENWTSDGNVYYRNIYYDINGVYEDSIGKAVGLSVRCVAKDYNDQIEWGSANE